MAESSRLLKNIFQSNFCQIRTLIKNKVSDGGIQYYGFKYHPRHPDFKDPPYEPSKLFFVTRIKPVWGTNPIERQMLKKLNIDGHIKTCGHKAVVKNIPEVNAALWRIKHLVRIVPIHFPQGYPESISLGSSYLHDDGRLEVFPKIEVYEQRIALADEFKSDPKRLDSNLLKRYLRNRWNNPYEGTINEQ